MDVQLCTHYDRYSGTAIHHISRWHSRRLLQVCSGIQVNLAYNKVKFSNVASLSMEIVPDIQWNVSVSAIGFA